MCDCYFDVYLWFVWMVVGVYMFGGVLGYIVEIKVVVVLVC